MAYNTKLYRSTGSSWDEIRVGSEWGLIENKPSTFTPTAHSHSEYLPLTGGTATGKIFAPSTLPTDPINTLTTKNYVDVGDKKDYNIITKNSSFTVDNTYKTGDLIVCTNSSQITVTLEGYTDHPIGTRIDFFRMGVGEVRFYPAISASIIPSKYYIKDRYMAVSIIKRTNSEWILVGALKS